MNRPVRFTWIRVMYAANIIGGGVPGFLVTFFPEFAERSMFGAVAQDGLLFGVTGSVWLAIGLLSALGLFYPLPLIGVFMVRADRLQNALDRRRRYSAEPSRGPARTAVRHLFCADYRRVYLRGTVSLPLRRRGFSSHLQRAAGSVNTAGLRSPAARQLG